MQIPRASEESKKVFKGFVPADPRITVRPMFGNESAFVNGNMFFGLFGNDLFVRLSEQDQREFLKNEGAYGLEPMKGRPMKGYVILPKAWWKEPRKVASWVQRSLIWTSQLPEKRKAKK